MKSNWVTVASCVNRLDAEMRSSFLASEGLESRVASDDVGGMTPHLGLVGGYRLVVRAEDESRALAALASVEVSKAP